VTIGAGKLNRRIRFERATVTRSPVGTELEGPWTVIQSAWAAVSYGKADERREAAVANSQQSATFTVRASTALREASPRDRIIFGTEIWSIAGAALSPDRSTIAFTATRVTG